MLNGCATSTSSQDLSSDGYKRIGYLTTIANTCKENGKINDKEYASFINSIRQYTAGVSVSKASFENSCKFYTTSMNTNTLLSKCYEVYAFIEEQNQVRERINANAASSNRSNAGDEWSSVGTINKVPVCTKIGTSIYCN